MHKILIILFILFGCIQINAQGIRASIPIGFNGSQIDGDGIAGYHKFGIHGGVGASLFLASRDDFEFGFELIYQSTGSKSSNIEQNQAFFYREILFKQLSLPLFINYIHSEGGYLGIGVSVNRTLDTKWKDINFDVTTGNVISIWEGPVLDTQFSETDLTGLVQIGYAFNDNFRTSLRFNYSIIPFGEQIRFGDINFRLPRHNYVTLRVNTLLYGLFK